MPQSPYEILGVGKDTNNDDIKKAYRTLAFRYHPDKNRSEGAEAKFKEVAHAYSILSDPVKKLNYDQFGNTAFNDTISPIGVFQKMFGQNPMMDNMFFMTGNINEDMKNFTQNFINLRPIIVKVDFTLEQAYNGDTISKSVNKKVKKGKKLININETIVITIPKGVNNRERQVLKECGNEDISGKKGDIMCIFSEVKHKLYTRKREHLFLEKRILLSEALSGLEYILDTIYDAKILITSSADEIIDNDTIHQLPNLGLPIKNTQKFGNLYITYKIVFPKELDENRKKLILKILPKRKGLTPASQYLTCKTPQICQDRDIVLSRDGIKNPIKQMLENMLGGDIFGGDMFGLGLGIDVDIGDSMGECVQQ